MVSLYEAMDYIREYKSFINSHNLNGAIRITAGITIPAILLSYFNNLSVGIAVSIGAMCVANTDNPGPIHHRRNGMIAGIIIIFIAALLTGMVSGSGLLTGVLVFVFCFLFSMMSIYGNRASSIGVNALLVMVLSIDRPQHGWESLINALYILAGGTWYTVLSLLLYSFRPYKLIQQALGDCVESTADYLRIKASFYAKEVDYDRSYRQLVDRQIDLHEKQELLRELLFKSRDIVRESTHTGRVLVMIFLDIVDLFERVMTSQQDYQLLHRSFDESGLLSAFRGVILDMAIELDEIGVAVKSGKPSVETPHLAARIKKLRETFIHYRDQHRRAENVEGFIGLRHILESLEDIGDRLHTLHGYTTYDRRLSKDDQPPVDYEQFITHQDIDKKLVFENLSLRSHIFRHSLRVSIATIAGYIISGFLPFGHGYWILLTIIVILKPAYSLTKKRNFERLMGTLAGALAGLLILYFIHDRNVLFVLMILFMIGTYVFIRTNYLVCVTLMTPYVLLLFHLLYPADFRSVLSDRVIDTAIGSALAFLANIFIVPSWEREQLSDYMIRIIEANAAYLRDVAGAFLGKPASVTQYKLSRKDAFVALANLSDAFGRILSEPRGKREEAGRMHQFVVSNHMLTSHIATLSYYALPQSTGYANPGLYQPVVDGILDCLEDAAAGLKASENGVDGKGAGPEDNGMGVMARQDLRLLNDQLNALLEQRRAELGSGLIDSDTRRQLSGLKPVVDQFNFIAKVVSNIGRLSRELSPANYSRPTSPGSSIPVPSS
ncbi:FUSC family membrane protein [Flavitalea sp. BT771]|uniref:FUSC family protein n=1 Tax=Flavitalea sp. BT771 TaxID=3063329 RepID=UPI0026E28B18|nr:FUSC family membrane protein [Flavitalea sp. BT771]MDO6434230.1 FUSC family membrane protein [Flavitalea sp. BT771]MDV6223130.1 FUSC family membrane protein [Flavitalea sp. BT771]